MKKMLLIVAIVLYSGTINAQEFVEFGAKAGVNIATLSVNGPWEISNKTGFNLGLIAEIYLVKNFSFQPELLYSTQGYKAELSELGTGNAEETYKLEYVNLPVLAKYYFIPGLSLEVGPQIGFLIKGEREYEIHVDAEHSGTVVHNGTVDLKDETKVIDFAVVGGLAYELPMGLFFSGRYNLGVSNILKEFEERLERESKNRVLQLSVGYKF